MSGKPWSRVNSEGSFKTLSSGSSDGGGAAVSGDEEVGDEEVGVVEVGDVEVGVVEVGDDEVGDDSVTVLELGGESDISEEPSPRGEDGDTDAMPMNGSGKRYDLQRYLKVFTKK